MKKIKFWINIGLVALGFIGKKYWMANVQCFWPDAQPYGTKRVVLCTNHRRFPMRYCEMFVRMRYRLPHDVEVHIVPIRISKDDFEDYVYTLENQLSENIDRKGLCIDLIAINWARIAGLFFQIHWISNTFNYHKIYKLRHNFWFLIFDF